jgi:hypothetical protein
MAGGQSKATFDAPSTAGEPFLEPSLRLPQCRYATIAGRRYGAAAGNAGHVEQC